MPRKNRQYSEVKVYHIILRGIDKQDIFLDDIDRKKFLEILRETKNKYGYEIYAYCLMDNHVHIIIYDKLILLSKLMQSIEISYSMYFNRKYNRVGHLFQNRFLSKKVEEKSYLIELCRYIHQNPLKSGIEKTEKYMWSSYIEYVEKPYIINSKMILSIFSKDEFINFHKINLNKNMYELLEYEMAEQITDDQLNKYICEILDIKDVHVILELSIQKRDKAISKIKERKIISNTQLSRVIGINRKIIERAIKK